jgi:hypothetical protein
MKSALGLIEGVMVRRKETNYCKYSRIDALAVDIKAGTHFRCPAPSWTLKSGTVKAAFTVHRDTP